MRRFFLPGIVFLLFLFSACGKKGDPLPPLVFVPKPVEQLDLVQQGLVLILEWRLPTVYTDGSPISGLSALEFWMLSEEKDPESELPYLSEDRFREQGDIILEISSEKFLDYKPDPESSPQKFRYEHPLNLEDLGKKRITFALVVKDNKRKYSSLSQLRSIDPLAVSDPPDDLKAEVLEDHIEITWGIPKKNMDDSEPAAVKGYNLYRSDAQGSLLLINPTLVIESKFEDKNFSFGKLYRYMIRSVANDLPPYIESSDSEVIEVLTEDVFAPSPPKGLVAIAGENFVSLSWDLSREPDLASYRVWRRLEGDKEFLCLTPDGISENAFTDSSVEQDNKYEYMVTGVDQSGNESKQSKQVSIYIRGEG